MWTGTGEGSSTVEGERGVGVRWAGWVEASRGGGQLGLVLVLDVDVDVGER